MVWENYGHIWVFFWDTVGLGNGNGERPFEDETNRQKGRHCCPHHDAEKKKIPSSQAQKKSSPRSSRKSSRNGQLGQFVPKLCQTQNSSSHITKSNFVVSLTIFFFRSVTAFRLTHALGPFGNHSPAGPCLARPLNSCGASGLPWSILSFFLFCRLQRLQTVFTRVFFFLLQCSVDPNCWFPKHPPEGVA